eukprot:296442-Ditylum_brightwellii.AAC.1
MVNSSTAQNILVTPSDENIPSAWRKVFTGYIQNHQLHRSPPHPPSQIEYSQTDHEAHPSFADHAVDADFYGEETDTIVDKIAT